MKKNTEISPSDILRFLFAVTGIFLLLKYPERSTAGIRDGIRLLVTGVIPSLFPFLIISSFITSSPAAEHFCRSASKIFSPVFKISAPSVSAVILGLTGGYPVGAKTVSELYSEKKISRSEAERLLMWCVNPGPAFTVTTVGTLMLGDAVSGAILFVSILCSSLTIGFFCRFLASDREYTVTAFDAPKSTFADSVHAGSAAMINICAWILVFSCIGAFTDLFCSHASSELFVKAALEVTTGCKEAAGKVSLPFISAVLGFGGISVICQISPYIKKCGASAAKIVSARALNASLCAFYSSAAQRLFPRTVTAVSTLNAGKSVIMLNSSLSIALLLIMMCLVFIFEVDYRRKMC